MSADLIAALLVLIVALRVAAYYRAKCLDNERELRQLIEEMEIMKSKIIALALVLACPVASAAELVEGPSFKVGDETVTPVELLGTVREKRKHWYSLKLGKKFYAYKCAENGKRYLSTEPLALVMDPRSYPKKHPYIYGGFEVGKIAAGAAVTGALSAGALSK